MSAKTGNCIKCHKRAVGTFKGKPLCGSHRPNANV